jgi:hypothetical protein
LRDLIPFVIIGYPSSNRLAQEYLRQLGCDVNVTKGFVVSEMRHQWGFNSLIGETDKKELHVNHLRVFVVAYVRQSHALIFLQVQCEYLRKVLGFLTCFV